MRERFRLLGAVVPKHTALFVLSVLALIALVLAQLGVAWSMKLVLDAVLVRRATFLLDSLIILVAMVITIPIMSSLARLSRSVFGARCARDLRNSIYEKMLRMRLDERNKWQHGDLTRRLFEDVNMVESMLSESLTGLVYHPLLGIGALVYLARINHVLAAIMAVFGPGMYFFQTAWSRLMYSRSQQAQQASSELMSSAVHGMSSTESIKAMRAEGLVAKLFAAVNTSYYAARLREWHVAYAAEGLGGVVASLPFILVFLIGGTLTLHRSLSPGVLLSALQQMNYVSTPFASVASEYQRIQAALPSVDRITEIVASPSDLYPEDFEDHVPGSATPVGRRAC